MPFLPPNQQRQSTEGTDVPRQSRRIYVRVWYRLMHHYGGSNILNNTENISCRQDLQTSVQQRAEHSNA